MTAEKREATVSDTSISITALGEMMIEDFGLQGADDLVNFIPATTRDAYDIRIRGVGRNFPRPAAAKVPLASAAYFDGVYSEDFGIASSENGLYDVARIEVLRGPQGRLLQNGNSIGAMRSTSWPTKPTYGFGGELPRHGRQHGHPGILRHPVRPHHQGSPGRTDRGAEARS
ncbi:MAG: hypothetical protein U5Q16_08060 [Gammaproteobacteria bacterium]|nr:hypothetical protein [Gammaproteobacteria bacterium]